MHNWVAQRPDFKSALRVVKMVLNTQCYQYLWLTMWFHAKKSKETLKKSNWLILLCNFCSSPQMWPKNTKKSDPTIFESLGRPEEYEIVSMRLWVWNYEYEIVSMKLWWQTTAGRAWHSADRGQFRLPFTRPLLQKGSSLQEEILSVLLFVCLFVCP